jgi:hypothetical protein
MKTVDIDQLCAEYRENVRKSSSAYKNLPSGEKQR